ncbi:sigma 54-interacting transcriptional regulator [Melittangium boletus]|uniref:sigma 54-interacting transcriptional regulator n=1 Tax=Melittangium boletus TaxID=83453 RepID=UPI003DA52089
MSEWDEEGGPPQARTATATLPRKVRSGRVRLKLLVLSGPEAGKSHVLEPGRTYVLGKDSTADIVLTEKTVSRQHLSLEVREDCVLARDLGSRNGSLRDGLRFSELELGPGSEWDVGSVSLKLVPQEARARSLLLSSRESFGGLVGHSRRMREVFTLLERMASGTSDVLIQAETGTGKELCAEALHKESPRAKGPFVIVDLAGIAPSLIESELFGHVKGAFTGAQTERAGAFERASGGTVFLDEVGELPLDLQPRLLRVLERRQVKRVGANEYRTVDMRVVAATHVDLESAVDKGKFRADLYHRLAVLKVVLPPLRERPEDIPFLVDHFLRRMGRPQGTLSDQTRALLAQYPWPGNVRELRNVVEQVVNLGEDALPEMTPPGGLRAARGRSTPELSLPFKEAKERLIDGFEQDYVRDLLARCEGNISRAAREAGIDRMYLYKLVKKHGLDAGRSGGSDG